MMRLIHLFYLAIVLLPVHLVFGEIPVRISNNSEATPDVAYNSQDDEFLVVWTEWIPQGGFNTLGPVMGQRVKSDGKLLGTPFTIFTVGAEPKVAYNWQRNEYLVTCVYLGTVQTRRLSAAGALLDAIQAMIPDAGSPRVLYNQIADEYLVVGASLEENPTAPGFCDITIYSRRVRWSGSAIGNVNTVAQQTHGLCSDGAIYGIDYANVTSQETPTGRYLLAIEYPGDLMMLDSDGRPMPTLYNPQSNIYYNSIPFQLSKLGITHDVDVAFGHWNTEPVFLLVWSDRQQTYNGEEWVGIWGGLVNAEKIDYLTTEGVSNTTFPISFIFSHNTAIPMFKSWKPKATYDGLRFTVAWRETPGTDPENETQAIHIRANSVSFGYLPPQAKNVILSTTNGDEEPRLPAIAASTKTGDAFVAWEDSRNFSTTQIDLYGALMTAQAIESVTLTAPNGGENWQVGSTQTITWTSSSFSGSVRLEYSTDGNTFTLIASNVANTGSYSWTIPDTPSSTCFVRISDDADGQPWDISDAAFTISKPAQNTPAGQNVQVSPGNGIDMTFDEVTNPGNTTLNVLSTGPPPPNGFFVFPNSAPVFYDIETTATFNGNVTICIPYDDTNLTPVEETKLKLFAYETPPGQWQDITVSVDINANIICGQVSHLSLFAFLSGPSHFSFTYNTGASYSIVIDAADVDGNPLANGDEIGVFTPAGLCVGASVWDGSTPLA